MTETHDNHTNQRIVINFDDTTELEIESLDVGVADGVLSFDISGRIRNLADDQLDDLTGAELRRTELHLTVA